MECRILIHDDQLNSFDWCHLDSSNGNVLKSGSSDAEELKKLCSESQNVTVFLPQQDILLSSHKFPQKVSKQQLNAIAYTIEDSLGQDIEDCFFSTAAEQEGHEVPVAVISRNKMDLYAEFLVSHQINSSNVLPPFYLCPWNDDESTLAVVCNYNAGFIIRYGIHLGCYCAASALEKNLRLIISQNTSEQTQIVIYADESLVDIKIPKTEIVYKGDIQLLAQNSDAQHAINLKQKEYRTSHQFIKLIKNWSWPIVAASLLLVVFIFGQLMVSWTKEQQFNELRDKQISLLQKYLPNLNIDQNPKKQLIKALSESQNGSDEVGFIDLLHEYIQIKSKLTSIKTNRIQFQQSKLVINLESKDLKSLEDFRSKLTQSRFKATIEDVNISPEKTTGRLVMKDS